MNFLQKPKNSTEAIREIAERLYLNRQARGEAGDAESDWAKAERIAKSPIRSRLFHVHQRFIWVEKQAIEPTARWVERADLFRIIEKLSPTIEALGVIAIPLVLFFAAQSYEERLLQREQTYQENVRQQELERSQQQAVTDYLNQLSTILLDMEGDLDDSQNEGLRTLTTATTLTLLRDPNLDGNRKGQVIEFLSQMNLVQREFVYGPQRPEDTVPIISLRTADLSSADLRGTDLSNADLSFADLSFANLRRADLFFADLSFANLRRADLFLADLSDADLSGADLSDAILHSADLSNADLFLADLSDADLSDANLSGADLRFADLSGADLSGANLSNADLFLADLSLADLLFADLSGANLSGANLSGADLSFANLRRADLFFADLSGANLSGAFLSGANLSGADLRFANLRRADLRFADLSGANLSGAFLGGAEFAEAYLCETQLPEGIDLDPNRDCGWFEELFE
ncbi:MAG: pentapeptide repeat-containing protein [Leptolyngbya sp. SIO1E4]|nr:pentapeptide repeat-containing protein [Leptolyngbya sp. SIO1E4]